MYTLSRSPVYAILWYLYASLSHAWTETPWSGNTWTEDEWTETFLTRPGQETIKLNIITNSDPALLAPGYIWLSAYRSFRSERSGDSVNRRWGPHVFDSEGNLVWAGNSTTDVRGWGPGPCDYLGETSNHICYADANFMEQGGHTSGSLKFFDNTYQEVARFKAIGGLRDPDSHEINTINGGETVINDVYEFRDQDLREYGGFEDGHYLDGCFQERSLRTGELIFQMCLSEVIPFEETSIYPNGASEKYHGGAGDTSASRPWDLFHINAIDQDEEGNYYVSCRNMRTVYKIAGRNHPQPKTVIWKLCGNDNKFELGEGVEFSYQHHVRVLGVTAEETVISLFDNSWDGIGSKVTAEASSGKVIVLNNSTMTARLAERYWHPEMLHSGFAGSNQVHLANGNAFLGWGVRGEISEHAGGMGGQTLWYAKYGVHKDLESYRCWKREWHGYPTNPPDVFAFAGSCESEVMVYMSWNGATEYVAWRIYAADSDDAETGDPLGEDWPREGYETLVNVGPYMTSGFRKYVYAAAIDNEGNVLGTSELVKVFVPRQSYAEAFECDANRCNRKAEYNENESMVDYC